MSDGLMIPHAIRRDGSALFATDDSVSDLIRRSVLRVEAFQAYHRDAAPVLRCPACPGHLYPRLSPKRRVHWAHIASEACPLAQEWKLSQRQLDALLYDGRQEGPAHLALVQSIADMAMIDPLVDKSSVVIGRYLPSQVPEWHGRYPDVRFSFNAGSIAIEVQLSPICLHRLAERTLFYRAHGYTLIWVTRDFDPDALKPTWLWDIWAAQGAHVFSVDAEVLNNSATAKNFLLKRHAITETASAIIGLEDIVPAPWHVNFKRRWQDQAKDGWAAAIGLTQELLTERGISAEATETWAICHTLNTMMAIEKWEPIGSRHTNPRALINDFLNSGDARLSYRFIYHAFRHYRPDDLEKGKAKEMIRKAKQRAEEAGLEPWNSQSAMASIASDLFPDWTDSTKAGSTT